MPTTWSTVTDPIGDTGAFDSRMIFGDFDGDGDIDILFQNGNTAGAGIGYMRNNGNGTFTTFTDATSVGSLFAGVDLSGRQITPANFFILDFDGDGDLDILDRTSNTTVFFQNNGNSSFTRIADPAPDTGAFDQRMVWGDFDGDGDVDALYQNGNTAGAGIGYLRNDGGLSFTNFTNAAAAGTPFTGVVFTGLQITTSTFVIDIDDDGDLDIVDRGSTQVLYRNDGGGGFTRTADPMGDIGNFDARMVYGDFDSDGDVDAIYQNGNVAGSGFGYFRNDGGTFTNFTTLTGTPFASLDLTGQQLTTWTAVDIDNDGDVDIIDRDQAGGGLVMYRQNGAPPRLSATTPSDNGTGVATTANIVLTFSESVSKGNGNIYLYRGDGTLIETIAIGSAQVTGSGTTWTIDPSVTLAGGTNYYVLIDQETFADIEDAVFAGIYNNTTLNFTTAVANTAPTFTNLNGDAPAYTEDGAAVRLDVTGNATVADTEQANFNGGTLTVAITAGGTSGEDVLSVANIGTGAGQISVAGGAISYQGVQIGTFTGGTAGANLVITLDSDATVAATQALVRALQYNNSNGANPSTTGRTVTVVLTDGAGGTSTTQTVTVGVSAVNDAPTFTNLTGDTPAYTEGGAAVRLDVGGNATVADVDNANFNGGTLTVAITAGGTAAQDALSVANIGTGSGQISVSGANISYQGVQIATFTGGTSGANLVITLDSDATPAATQALVRALQYLNTNTDNPSTTSRTVTVTLTDGSGGTAAVQSLTLGVSAVNDAAVVTAGDTPTYTEGGSAVAVSPTLTIADVDSATMTGATVTVTDFVSGDVLNFIAQNGISAAYNGATGVLTLSGAASVANYQAALRSITYSGAADANVGGTDPTRTISFVVTDGTASNTATATVTVADAPAGPSPGDDNLPGTAGDDSISGLGGEDVIDGGDGDDYLNGGDGDDELLGGANNDYLKGGTGADHMVGGTGNDFYVVDDAGDTPDETGGDGIDTVATTVSWTLGVGFENLTLGASGGTINGTGNSLDNVINGNYAANTLTGLAGADTLNGAGGNDFLYGGDDIDTLDGGTQDDFLDGGAGNDILIGGLGADFLRGGTGADAMSGGAGNDIYEVDNVGDSTDETGGSGIDEVRAFITWTLATDIEKLTLEATGGAINGTGNALANTITGNASANTLSGLDGADLLYGLGGNDVLLGGLAADKLYGGDDDDQLQGGAGNDQLFGDNGHDTLIGGLGSDNLTGGSGHDVFAFVNDDLHIGTPLEQDRVLDFSLADGDRIDLSAIDANTVLGGDQAFSIVSTFSNTAGEMKLFYRTGSNQTQVLLDVNGDGVADHEILINGNVTGMGVLTGGEPITQGGWVL